MSGTRLSFFSVSAVEVVRAVSGSTSRVGRRSCEGLICAWPVCGQLRLRGQDTVLIRWRWGERCFRLARERSEPSWEATS